MKRAAMILLAACLLAGNCWAARPAVGEEAWITPVAALEEHTEESGRPRAAPTGTGYSDAEINEITNVVNGEVGGIGGASVVLTYADGSQLYTDGYALRRIHACVVDNQVRSGLFPSTVDGCVRQCWSWLYAVTNWRTDAQWQSCREAVAEALSGGAGVPSNVYAATCDPAFASYGAGWYLWARVDWDTGWYSGVYYYYADGG